MKNYAAVNAEISQRLGHVTNRVEYGTLQSACADVLFLPYSSAQVNLFSTLRTAASKYNNSLKILILCVNTSFRQTFFKVTFRE